MDAVSLKKIAYDKLQANLDEMLKQYRLLLECVRKEKDYLISTEIEKLNENNFLKEQLTSKIKSLDASRMTYATELAHLLSADVQQPRLLEIAQKMGGTEAERLRQIHSALEIVIQRLTELNKHNAFYAENALKTVNAAMENIKEQLVGKKSYQQKGKYKVGPETSGHFIKQEA